MGDFLVWLVLGAFVVLIFCIYSLSSQLERCVRLAVEIITGNQRRILEQLETLNHNGSKPTPPNVVLFDRRLGQRRRTEDNFQYADERRQQQGRRWDDLATLKDEPDRDLVRSER